MSLTVDDLEREYHRARRRCDSAAMYTALERPQGKCRYCGNTWLPWAGSKLDGHAKCIVDASFKHFVSIYLNDPKVTVDFVARVLNVSVAVVRSWYHWRSRR